MLDNLYTKLTKKIPYKLLIITPLLFSGLMVLVIFSKGIPMSIDFQGGTWMEVTLTHEVSDAGLAALQTRLKEEHLEGLKVYSGTDLETSKPKLTIITTTLLNESRFKQLLGGLLGENFTTEDILLVDLTQVKIKDAPRIEEKLKRIYGRENVELKERSLTIKGLDLDKEKVVNNLRYYLNTSLEPEQVKFKEKNFILDHFDPLLGKAFWVQGVKALLIASLLMIFIIFFAFRDFVPSMAVILAATGDAVIAAGGMAIFNISLEPASLTALLMLIGYSVDTDIMLTTRVLKNKVGEVNDRINDAMKTGLTMTLTTLGVMLVILLSSGMLIRMGLTQMTVLLNIASVLFLGLVGDLMTTWFMNAGILKWYMEEKGGKFSLFKRKKRWR